MTETRRAALPEGGTTPTAAVHVGQYVTFTFGRNVLGGRVESFTTSQGQPAARVRLRRGWVHIEPLASLKGWNL